MLKKIFTNSFKISAIAFLLKKLRPGQPISVSILSKGAGRRIRVVLHSGFVFSIKKFHTNFQLILRKSIFGYSFKVRVFLNSSALFRFFV
jgi:hypothetical protein